ncbi:MAG TPA: hypothetical protein VGB48_07595 [Allosphingosinicella sp.]|jgi:hypothetical protein
MSVAVRIRHAAVGLTQRLEAPREVPPLDRRALLVLRPLWWLVFLLALAAPVGGTWDRFANPAPNSLLMLGSRAGVVLDENDLTRIRFPVGPAAKAAGLKAGDRIVAIDGIEVSRTVPLAALEGEGANPMDQAAFAGILYGTDEAATELTLHAPDGSQRAVRLTTGERHVEQGAKALGIPSWMLTIIDLLHLLTYPFLLAAAWMLYRRCPHDAVSTLLSFAILLTMAGEQPSAAFLTTVVGVPQAAQTAIFDLGNVLLLAGVLLFPHGRIGPWPVVASLLATPLLFFLSGDLYRVVFMLFMALSVALLVRRMKSMAPSPSRQQIKWALFGFAGYAIFLGGSLLADMLKGSVATFWQQLFVETFAGLSLGLAFLCLQLGLLVALLRFRLYDAESVISRSATFGIVMLAMGVAFAAGAEAIEEAVKAAAGRDAGPAASIVAAAMATLLASPAHGRIQRWTERLFHENLLKLRRDLPETVRDLREIASLPELLGDVLLRVKGGVRTVRAAIAVNGDVSEVFGATREQAKLWLAGFTAAPEADKIACDPSDLIFPVRVSLCAAQGGTCLGWLLIGPRPDGTQVSGDEREALAEIADPIARAIHIVVKRERQEGEISALLAEQMRRIEALEARLAPGAAAAE